MSTECIRARFLQNLQMYSLDSIIVKEKWVFQESILVDKNQF